jgi:hypothetical protein
VDLFPVDLYSRQYCTAYGFLFLVVEEDSFLLPRTHSNFPSQVLDYLASLSSPQEADPPEDDISHKFIPKKVGSHGFFALMLSKYGIFPIDYLEGGMFFEVSSCFGSALVSKRTGSSILNQ